MNPLGSPHSVGGSFHVIPSHVYQSLIAGNSSPSSRNRESPMVNFSGIGPRRRREADDEDPEAEEEEEEGDLERQPEKKRRLTAAQVQYLEKSFEVENKLEPERKNQLAKELSLQPRQVAIWFQNRRARFKTKQLERDYADLKSNFESLKSDYDDLLKERDQLQNEVSMLRAELNLRKAGSSNSPTDAKPLAVEAAAVAVKLEEASSVKSDVFDSESPHSTSQAERSEFSHEVLTGSFIPVAEFGFGKAEEGGFDGGSCSGLGLTGLEGHPSYWPWLY